MVGRMRVGRDEMDELYLWLLVWVSIQLFSPRLGWEVLDTTAARLNLMIFN